MSRYIDAELIITECLTGGTFVFRKEDLRKAEVVLETVVGEFARVIQETPTADVVEVVHGEWSHLGGDEWCCTNCGEVICTEGSWEKPEKKFCHECGAKMDGKKVE